MASETRPGTDWEERAGDAEAALEDALEERNRLWEELHHRAAQEREVEHLRSRVAAMEASLSWRITKPLRAFKRFFAAIREKLAERRARRG